MDSKPLQICRLCLLTSDDAIHIWETFDDSSIASILEKHFWFQVHKNDGLTEWLCQLCWIQTKTFHEFYVKVERYHKYLLDSAEKGTGEPDETADGKEAAFEPYLNLVECEPELTLHSLDSQISKDDSSDNDCDQNETEQVSDQLSDKKIKVKTSNSLSEKERQNAQIREFFTMKCEICSAVEFQTFLDARRHYRKVHKTEGYLMCCGNKFGRRHFILNHILTHINPDAFRCDQCEKSFRNKNALKLHIDNHVPLDSRPHKCSLCTSSFAKDYLLKHHVRYKHGSDETFPCDKCDKSFRSKLYLTSHIRCVHEYSLEHVCDTCAHRFKTKLMLTNHINNKHSTTPRPKVQCDICGVWLKHKLAYQKHLSRMHQDGKDLVVKCPSCDKMTKNKAALANHIRTVHGERRHKCALCDKAFKCTKNLKEHMALHTGEYLYNCPYCEKKFKSNANMYSHRKKAHLAEWARDSTQRNALNKNCTSEEIELDT